MSRRRHPPLLLPFAIVLAILAALPVLGDVRYFSLPEERVTPGMRAELQARFPERAFRFLNGPWTLLEADGAPGSGTVNLPGSRHGGEGLRIERRLDLADLPLDRLELVLAHAHGTFSIFINDSLIATDTCYFGDLRISLPAPLLQPDGVRLGLSIAPLPLRTRDLPAFTPVAMPRLQSGILRGLYLAVRPRHRLDLSGLRMAPTGMHRSPHGEIRVDGPALSPGAAIRLRYLGDDQLQSEATLSIADGVAALPPWPDSDADSSRSWGLAAELVDSAGTVLDRVNIPVARQRVELRDNILYRGGAATPVRGVNYVYQTPEGAQLFDEDLAARDLADIAARGFTAIRVILNPLPERFYQLCDDLGLQVFQDLPFVYFGHRTETFRRRFPHWRQAYEQVAELASRHGSLSAIGLAYAINGASPLQRRLLASVRGTLGDAPLPTYVSTLLPAAELRGLADIQIVEMIERSQPTRNWQKLLDHLQGAPFMPSGFVPAMAVRLDTLRAGAPTDPVATLHELLEQDQLPGTVPGFFMHTYADYYLHLPSIQYGHSDDPRLSATGLVDAWRKPRAAADGAPYDVFGDDGGGQGFLYVFIGLLNLILLLLTLNRYRVFRHNVAYSIRKPHGFFVNLQERISIPYKESFFLLVVISLNGALISSSAAYFYRTNLMFDYLVSLFVFIPVLKERVVAIVWDPALFLAAGSIAIILIFYLMGLLTKLFSLTGRSRVLFRQALAASVWSASPFVLLVPLGIVMYRLLLMMKSYWIPVGALLYFHAWLYLRWINGTRVLTDRLYSRVFLVMTVLLCLAAAAAAFGVERFFPVWEHLLYVKAVLTYHAAG